MEEAEVSATLIVLLIFAGALLLVSPLIRSLWRMDEERRRRPHPDRSEGGASFGDTTHWGGWGRPGQ